MSAHERLALVIGATGQQGGAAARQLLAAGWRVRALVRSPTTPSAEALWADGAEVAVGDLDEPDTVQAAMAGVAGVFVALTMMAGPRISPEGVVAERRRGLAIAELASRARIGHLVYSSISGADAGTAIPYYESKASIEARIRELGVPATILRPVSFMDNFNSYNRPVLQASELVVSLPVRPDKPMAFIAVRDIGAFAAIAFDHADEFVGRSVDIAGDILTPVQVAATFGRVTGVLTRHHRTPIDEVRAFDEQLAMMFSYFDSHPAPPIAVDALRRVHPGLMGLETWLRTTGWRPSVESTTGRP